MMVLAKCNGTWLVDEAGKLGVVERGGAWVTTAMFIALLMTVIPGVAGVAMLASGERSVVPIPFLAISAAAAFAFVLLLRHKRRANADTAVPAPWLVFDVPGNVVLDSAGAVLCQLDQVSLAKVGQMASSSRALVAYCPNETVIARGNPFGDSVADLEHALRSRGIGSRPDLALRAAMKR